MSDRHATVKIDGKDIPLIGIPESETLDRCDRCGDTFHLSQLQLTNQLLCQKCRAPTPNQT